MSSCSLHGDHFWTASDGGGTDSTLGRGCHVAFLEISIGHGALCAIQGGLIVWIGPIDSGRCVIVPTTDMRGKGMGAGCEPFRG